MSGIRLRLLTEGDISLGMALKNQVGWNQLEADWRRLLAIEPEGGLVAERGGVGIGTVFTCAFGPVGWVAMMLVEAAHRGQGVGRALMVHAIETLEDRSVESIRLDATPLGRPLYESLGFVAEATILRYSGIVAAAMSEPGPTPELDSTWSNAVPTCDFRATGTDRTRFLRRLLKECPETLLTVPYDGDVRAYGFSRAGSAAEQVGPCVGEGEPGAIVLAASLDQFRGRSVVVDVPETHAAARSIVESRGLAVARGLTRMTRGPLVAEDRARIWASSGPELG